MAKLSLIIATYNRSEQLLAALESLTRQSAPVGSWECIVVDNNSADDTRILAERFMAAHPELDIRTVTESRQGLSHARNRGIEESRGDYIAIIDDDEHVNSDFIRSYIEFFDSHSEYAAAGGRVIPEYPESGRPDFVSPYIERPLANPVDFGGSCIEFPRHRIPAGGNMAFRRDTLLAYGGFNTALGRSGQKLTGGEESYLFERMRADGVRFGYVHNAVIWHIIPSGKLTADYLKRLAFGIGASKYRRAALHGKTASLYMGEAVRWAVTLLLALWYAATLRPKRGRYLIMMRSHITRGIIKKE
ncbi:MAG: glycosyltransferase family 2 protein [Alistipes sp.]|nr:glycosyltransferase family 2 protein [Alistipes sp.]